MRYIKPEFQNSESMGRVSRDARLTFIEMWCQADDSGRLIDSPTMLRNVLFPYDDLTVETLNGWLIELENVHSIVRYEASGRRYIQIVNWDHQRIDKPGPSHIPPPSKALLVGKSNTSLHGKLSEPAKKPPRARGNVPAYGQDGSYHFPPLTQPNPIQSNPPPKEGAGGLFEDGAASPDPKPKTKAELESETEQAFGEFWTIYPKKEDKGDARVAFKRALAKVPLATIIAGVKRYARERASDARPDAARWTKLPATWLNRESWGNEPAPAPAIQADKPNGKGEHLSTAERMSRSQRAMLTRFRANGEWRPEWGGKPGEPGCTIPEEILREFNFEAAT